MLVGIALFFPTILSWQILVSILSVLIIILQILPPILDLCFRYKSQRRLPKIKIKATYEVKNAKDLEKVVNTKPFIEDPFLGKFIKGEAILRRSWSDIKKEVDFSMLQPLNLSDPYRIFIITGKAGMGKTTYMLWRLDELLQSKLRPFKRIIFLNPNGYELWAEDLFKYKPEETLLVLDAPQRGDGDEVFKKRCFYLFKLAIGELTAAEGKTEEGVVGPFKVLITIRDDEYGYLREQKEFAPIFENPENYFVYEITPQKLNPEAILKKYLNSYKIQYEVPSDREKIVMNLLASKSEGKPIYIRYIVTDLKSNNRSFSEETLSQFPQGIANLMWQTIKRGYYVYEDNVIPFLLLLLLHMSQDFSSYFFNFVIDKLVQKEMKKDIKTKIKNLRSLLQCSVFKDVEFFSMDSHLRESLSIGLTQPEKIDYSLKDIVEFYKQINDMQFQRMKEDIAISLRNHLRNGFKDKADVFLCVDLAKMGEEYLDDATKYFCELWQSSKLPKDYIDYVREELFELWESLARKYKAVYDDEKVIYCYENALDKLGVRTHLRSLVSYAHYLQKRILPKYKHGTQEFQRWKEKIESLHKEVIKYQKEQGIKDYITYLTLADSYKLSYQVTGKIEDLENALDNYLQSARVENTSIGYGTVRNYIVELMKETGIKKRTKPDLYYKCVQARIECSEKAYQLNPDNWKNCGDYGEDLLVMEKPEDAIPILERGINLLLKSNNLGDVEKRVHLSWFYGRIGLCYRRMGNIPKAKEFLFKIAEIENPPISYFNLINWMYKINEYQETINAFEKFKESFLTSKMKEKEKVFSFIPDILLYVAVSYEKLGKSEMSIFWKYYADVAYYLKDIKEWNFVGNRLVKYHKLSEARECFLKYIRIDSNNAQNLSQFAHVSYQLQKWNEAKICLKRALSIRKDLRDEIALSFLQQKCKSTQKIPDFYKVEDLLDLAVQEELKGNNEKALKYYSIALAILEKQRFRSESDILAYRFIGDAFWALGKKEEALRIYEKIKDETTGYEKIVAETIYWFMYKNIEK
jgi:tetratricopeptide (TPR) repeat protein